MKNASMALISQLTIDSSLYNNPLCLDNDITDTSAMKRGIVPPDSKHTALLFAHTYWAMQNISLLISQSQFCRPLESDSHMPSDHKHTFTMQAHLLPPLFSVGTLKSLLRSKSAPYFHVMHCMRCVLGVRPERITTSPVDPN